MATSAYFSPYAALIQQRQTRLTETRRVIFFLLAALAIFLVCLFYVNLHSRVALRSREVQAIAVKLAEKQRQNQDLAYQIAKETAPQNVEARAKKLKLEPITKWETVSVPGFSSKLKVVGQIPTTGPSLEASTQDKNQNRSALNPQLIWDQLLSLLGLGATPAHARDLGP